MMLSPTWFLRTLSMEMWICTILTYFGVFLGFFLSLFLYRKFRKMKDKKHSSFGEVFMYMWTFIASQDVQSRWSKHAFWKLQVLNVSILQIVVATGFSTFLVTLLSTKYYEMPFHELDDFATIRSHNICVWEDLSPAKFFFHRLHNGSMTPLMKWKGMLNNPFCDLKTIKFNSFEEKICETKEKAAFIVWENDVKDE